jgi:hypothetical protein
LKRALYALAVVSSVLMSPLVSCSSEPLERLSSVRPENTGGSSVWLEVYREPAQRDRPEPRAYLVAVAHLTSPLENVTVRELSRDHEPAVPRGLREPLAELLDDPDLESFDSAEAVVDHVSRTPGALGLLPWEAVDPRVKTLAVDGESPLRPGEAGSEDYPLVLGDGPGPDPD